MLALLHSDDRGKHVILGASFDLHDATDDLVFGLGGDRLVALGTKSLPNAGIKNSQEIVDFGDRAHRTTRIVAGRFLRNRD